MALQLTADLILGIGALGVAAVAIFMFLRATSDTSRNQKREEDNQVIDSEPINLKIESDRSRVKVPKIDTLTEKPQVEQARSKIRTLTLQQEILGMVMKRLFEAEDEGEISREERERLASNYDAEMKSVNEELRNAELIVSLNELEEIRSNIIEQFQETLNDTQQKIDLIIKELDIKPPESKIEEPKPKRKTQRKRPPRRKPIKPSKEEQEEVEEEPSGEEIEEDEEETSREDSVEDRLEKLKEDVLKELEELDRLELEA
jgi:hypothetical protein